MSKENLQVIDGDERVPFLRGVVTHSLVAKGLAFTDAYEAARMVRELVRRRQVISREELSDLIRSVVSERFQGKYALPARTVPKPAPTILVKESDYHTPFSKGVLSQSLQAAGLDPSVAYEIARETERVLLAREDREVSRDDLRRLIYDAIRRSGDQASSENYLLWRTVKDQERPLVILFGGATGTGKSSVAAEVAHRLGILRVLSTDSIRQIMRTMFSRDLLPSIHHSSFAVWEELPQLAEEESDQVIEAFKEQTRRVLVGVRALLLRAASENQSLIVEGVHLVPGLLDMSGIEERVDLVSVVVSTLNGKVHRSRFKKRESHASERAASRYRAYFEQIKLIQTYILEMADSCDIPIVETSNLEESVPEILSVISNILKEKLEIGQQEMIEQTLRT